MALRMSEPTPMMAQYLSVKDAHRDCLLLYRMGDFYELFFNDAEVAAKTLGIALTKRGSHGGGPIPMCGVPFHALDQYLPKLIHAGHRVAVCEQTEDPKTAKKRGGSKAVVNRDVVRILTPGTLTEDTFLEVGKATYLASFALVGGQEGALAWIDLADGGFFVQDGAAHRGDLEALLAEVDPGEVLAADTMAQHETLGPLFQSLGSKLTPQPQIRFSSNAGQARLKRQFNLAALDSLGDLSRAELAAAGALLDYVDLTQKGAQALIKPLRQVQAKGVMAIDAATRRNLELTKTLGGARAGSLLATIDRTLTGAGARLLAQRLSSPSTNQATIEARQDSLAYLSAAPALGRDVRGYLKALPDLGRAVQRLSLGRGGPRDMLSLATALANAGQIRGLLDAAHGRLPFDRELGDVLAQLGPQYSDYVGLSEGLGMALRDDVPLLARDGGFVRQGYRADLDEQLALRDQSRQLIAQMQADLAAETGIASLKIKHNNVLGYFIEVSATNADKMPSGPETRFIHRQTLASATRFTTVELSELEEKIRAAAEKSLALELEIFDQLRADILAQGETLLALGDALAVLDVSAALAVLAMDEGWVRPTLSQDKTLNIQAGRHPVVEAALKKSGGETFIPNDMCLRAQDHIWLLTGPNMAGKSTYLRANALIVILAQMGAYVPATSADVGLVDRLFSRVGASDDLASGRSTFMVEMVETATILNQATDRSFVILDEIGRGTATFDGLSIAWATVEYLASEIGARALFATHYHELTVLAERLEALSCHSLQVKEWQGEVIFLHEVAPGAADRSYGIHVGKLAGLPASVIARAGEVLERLETDQRDNPNLSADLPLFSASVAQGAPPPATNALKQALDQVHVDGLSPREAMNLLYDLKALSDEL